MVSLPIQLPPNSTVRVEIGQNVSKGETLAEKAPQHEYVIDLKKELQMTLRKIPKHLKKNPGDRVAKGDIVALKKNVFSETKIESNVDGTITSYKRDSGELVIQPNSSPMQSVEAVLSPVAGTISICHNGQIVIDTDEPGIVGISGIGGVVSASAHLVAYSHDEVTGVSSPILSPDSIGTIIIAKALNREQLIRAIGMEVTGIVGTQIEEDDMKYIALKKLTIPVIQIKEDDYSKLSELSKQTIAIDGNTGTILIL